MGLQSLGFADVNFDGLVDMVSVVSDGEGQQYVAVNYNTRKLRGLCGGDEQQ